LGCKAGLAGSHIGSVLFYLEAATRIHGKLACTQVNSSWILLTYVNEEPYARAKDIDFFISSKDLVKEKRDQRIEVLQQPQGSSRAAASSSGTALAGASARIGTFKRRNGSALCQTQPVQN